jgi:hypothetical protein
MDARGITRNGEESRLLRYEMELQRWASVRLGTSWTTGGDPVTGLSESSQLRYQELKLLATCEVLAAGLLGCDTVLLGQQFRRFDSCTAGPHRTEWPRRRRHYYRSNRRNYSPPARDTASYCTPSGSAGSLARSLSPLFYPDRRRATNLKNKFTVCSFCTCTRVQTCNQIITTLKLVRSVTQYPDFVKEFFTFQMSCGFTVRACYDLPAHETHGLPSADFHEVRKRTTTLRYTECQPHWTTRIEIHLCL